MCKRTTKFNFSAFLLLIAFGAVAQEKPRSVTERHLFEAQISRHVSASYLLSLPAAYRESKEKWPLIFFLHGGSGRGDDLNLVRQYGPPAVAAQRPDFPFVVLSPQCPKGEIWTDTDLLVSLLDDCIARYRIDRNRVYLMGMSLGGRGAWYLAYKYPDRFAALVPVCAWAPNADWVRALKDMPVWVFHGDKDTHVPLSSSDDMIKALHAIGNNARFTILPGRGHDIADVFDRPDLYAWLLQHRSQARAREN
jgi:predicted peptidase